MASDNNFLDRTVLTFAQAEGADPLPIQMQPKELSRELRALMWSMIWRSMSYSKITKAVTYPQVGEPWRSMLMDAHVELYHKNIDEFSLRWSEVSPKVKSALTSYSYIEFFGLLQYLIRHAKCPTYLPGAIDGVLVTSRAAYRVIDKTIVPIASEEEAGAVMRAFTDVQFPMFRGARSHLRNSTDALNEGRFADSARESIHAVESVARALTGKDKLSDALSELEKGAKIHKAMKGGFDRLYGWTSDEQGIRHPLLDEGDANVTEADALFMLGACASFVSLLIAKGRAIRVVPGD